jgi:S1-C subfamily serine protease
MLIGGCTHCQRTPTEPAATSIVSTLAKATVRVNYKLYQRGSGRELTARGTAVVFAKRGGRYYALTAAHVLFSEDTPQDTIEREEYWVERTIREETIPARKEEMDRHVDVAVISFPIISDIAVAHPTFRAPQAGDVVYTVGDPGAFTDLALTARVAGECRVNVACGGMRGRVFVMDRPIYHGHSGGGVVNERGELVGIATTILFMPWPIFGDPAYSTFVSTQSLGSILLPYLQ